MTAYLNALGVICALGRDKHEVARNLFAGDCSGMRSESGWVPERSFPVAAVPSAQLKPLFAVAWLNTHLALPLPFLLSRVLYGAGKDEPRAAPAQPPPGAPTGRRPTAPARLRGPPGWTGAGPTGGGPSNGGSPAGGDRGSATSSSPGQWPASPAPVFLRISSAMEFGTSW